MFGEAAVIGAMTSDGFRPTVTRPVPGSTPAERSEPTPADDAWIIFTSGSTGTAQGCRRQPSHRRRLRRRRGAAVPHRRPARPRRPGAGRPVGRLRRLVRGDVAGLALRRLPGAGAPLAGAQRAMDLGGWLVRHRVTVVSTVPTLGSAVAGRGPASSVRLLIFGGEACPPELAARLVAAGREVWNTYGPTEATVVAYGLSGSTGDSPVSIGLPLAGWSIAVVDAAGQPGAASASPENWSSVASAWPATSTPSRTRSSTRPCPVAGLGTGLPLRRPGGPRRRRAACSTAGRTIR